MRAQDWLLGIRLHVLEVAKMELRVEELGSRALPHGQRFDRVGHGGSGGGMDSTALAMVAAAQELDHERAVLARETDQALAVLYGRSGRGGLASERTSADADVLCCYYLMGMGWEQTATELCGDGERNSRQWCIMRAKRACEAIDRIGVARLADS